MTKEPKDKDERKDLIETARKRLPSGTIESYRRYAEQRRSYQKRLGQRRRSAGASREYRA